MSYKDQIIELDCSDLGEGCHVSLRNPKLCSWDDVRRDDQPGDPDADRRYIARFIEKWVVWDIDTGEELPIPSTAADPAAVLRRTPAAICYRIDVELTKHFPL